MQDEPSNSCPRPSRADSTKRLVEWQPAPAGLAAFGWLVHRDAIGSVAWKASGSRDDGTSKHGRFGAATLQRVIESEGPLLLAVRDFRRLHAGPSRRQPRLAGAALPGRRERAPDHHHPELPGPPARPHHPGRFLRRQRQGARAAALPSPELAVARHACARPASRRRTSTWCSARICTSITSAGTRGWRTAAGCRPFRTRAT